MKYDDEKRFGLAPIKKEGDGSGWPEAYKRLMEARDNSPEFEILGPLTDFERECPPTPTTQYVCACGSKSFTVHFIAGGYETSVCCLDCNEAYVVHSG